MAVPFSNTNLRIPRGFGNLLEGLAREVLRDQPEDIPTFAALYFSKLLKAREESGLDPAEWSAKMEDRFYNHDAFRDTEIQGAVNPAKMNTRHRTSHSESFAYSGAQFSTGKDLTACDSQNYKVKLNEKPFEDLDVREEGLTEDNSHKRTEGLILSAQESNKQVITVVNEDLEVDICKSEIDPTPLPTFGGLANVDVCAEEMKSPTDYKRDLESPKLQVYDKDKSESPEEIRSDAEQDLSKKAVAAPLHDDVNTESSETPDTLLEDTDSRDKGTGEACIGESADNISGKVLTESVVEAGMKSDEPQNENRSFFELVEETTDSTSENNSRSLVEIKDVDVDYSDDSRSKVIDILDDIYDQTYISENEAESCTDEENTSKIMDELKEENLLETPNPASQHFDSEIELSNELLNVSEKDLKTETITDRSDLESDEEEIVPDISITPQPDSLRAEDERANQAEALEENCLSEPESADAESLEIEAVGTSNSQPLQELNESTENDSDEEDELEEQGNEGEELTLGSENLEITDSSEPKEECGQPQEEEDIMDIPLDDPEANKAAAKIQAGFRGHMTRKKMKPEDKAGDEVSSSGDALNGSQGDSGGAEADATSGPEQ